jgi:hypothetical protein
MDVHGHEAIYRPPLHLCRLKQIPCHLLRPGRGFHGLGAYDVPCNTLQLLLDIGELSQCLQAYMEGHCREVPEDLIYDCCQIIQHRVLSLTPFRRRNSISLVQSTQTVDQDELVAGILEAVRIAALLYTLHVIFPVPRSSNVRQQLLPQLIAAIHDCRTLALSSELREILLWCSFTGAVAQTYEPTGNDWLASRSLEFIHSQQIRRYQDLKVILKSMAWVDLACDIGGLIVWNESFRMGHAI